MTNRKNQNSILFLTTLGVYLGLLLVGGTPGVMAQHAATTKSFELKDEIEVKDELDKKPDPTEEELDDAIIEYSNRIELFVRNLKAIRSIDKFDIERETFDTYRNFYSPCPATGSYDAVDDSRYVDHWLTPVLKEAKFALEDLIQLADCLPYSGFVSRNHARSSGIKLKYDKAELLHELSITLESEARAAALHKGLLGAFERFEIEEDEQLELNKVLYKHTSLTVSGNQVFIITRLPRAGLDLLLAKDAK